jgi:histone H3/H4
MEHPNDSTELNDIDDQTKGFTKPAITRLARRAGVKSMAEDCITPLKHLVSMKLDEILSTAVIVNSQHSTKTLMPDDIYEAFALSGINVARTEEF